MLSTWNPSPVLSAHHPLFESRPSLAHDGPAASLPVPLQAPINNTADCSSSPLAAIDIHSSPSTPFSSPNPFATGTDTAAVTVTAYHRPAIVAASPAFAAPPPFSPPYSYSYSSPSHSPSFPPSFSSHFSSAAFSASSWSPRGDMSPDPMTPPEVAPEKARRACEKCTRTKKKCDKALPKCERCTRLATACCYNFVYATPALTSEPSFLHLIHRPEVLSPPLPSYGYNPPSSCCSVATSTTVADAPNRPTAAAAPAPPAALLESEITAQNILSLLSSRGVSWRGAADLYFERVHHWISVVHRDAFRARTEGLRPGEDPEGVEMALLLVCMHLASRPAEDAAEEGAGGYAAAAAAAAAAATAASLALAGGGGGYPVPGSRRAHTPPASWPSAGLVHRCAGSPPGQPQPPESTAAAAAAGMLASPTYRSAKRLLVLLRAFSPASIELVQCGTLIALYELGHGDPWRAYVTFGEALAMAKLIGIRPGLWDGGVAEDEPIDVAEDEVCSLYWALFVLDKMLHFDFAFLTCPLQMHLPDPDSLLPAQNHLWSVKEGRSTMFWRRVPLSAEPNRRRLGAFQRAVQAAVLAHRAMLWEERARAAAAAAGTYSDLDAQARHLIKVIVFQEEVFAENCEALGMCFGVMLMLHATVLGGAGGSNGDGLSRSGYSSPHGDDGDVARAVAGINFVIRMVGDSSADANSRMATRPDLSSIFSPATAYAAYHALRVLATLENVIKQAESHFHEIYCCMYFLAKRWALAGRLLAIIEALLGGRDDDLRSMPGLPGYISSSSSSSSGGGGGGGGGTSKHGHVFTMGQPSPPQ